MTSTTYTVPANVEAKPSALTVDECFARASAVLSKAEDMASTSPAGAEALVRVAGAWQALTYPLLRNAGEDEL